MTLTNGTLTVNTYAFSYTIGNDQQTYGTAANLAADLSATIDTLVNGQNLSITYASTGDTGTAHVGTYTITGVVSNGTGLASDYTVTLTNGTLTVNKYAFSYTIGNDQQTYGTAATLAADLSATIDTLVNGQNLSISYASTGDTGTAHVGAYAVTGVVANGTGLASDYAVTLTNGTLTVEQVRLQLHDRQRPADLRHGGDPGGGPVGHDRHAGQRAEPVRSATPARGTRGRPTWARTPSPAWWPTARVWRATTR